ncbi:probable C-terminal domain small phosphatase [Selaginella moellendorffii]|uniref:probable C-terminal domain small phosphatase n=1 Tax=Selaginella moellendorffii TaxID=88036 RepID=UPI000D1C6540|nr:probable C-terminal domain small phosphatase [Selaginella moellendorffii]|eukprot:XP_024539796.1 probable C-terminal domain small phosphatase [Selaginella moellendorffii]
MKRTREYGDWSFSTLDIATKEKKKRVKVTHNSLPLPPALEEKPTLVLDMDETLIHAHKATASLKLFSGKILPLERYLVAKRPGVDIFLDEMSKIYEIVVFTRAVKPYADRILDRLDPAGNLFAHRLYRDSCSTKEVGGRKVVKDLSRLGRDLRHTVIVDDKPESFFLQPNNGIVIRAFKNRKGHKYDELKTISNLLKEIARVEDVRQALEKVKS